MDEKIFIGIDVGGTKIAGGLMNAAGQILWRTKHATPVQAPATKVVASITAVIKEIVTNPVLPRPVISGIGIAIPGLVDAQGQIIVTPNLNLTGVKLGSLIQNTFKTKVAVGNDVNCGVLGEQWLGAARGALNVVGIFPGTGVGGGLIINGKLLTGHNGAAAEIGHIVVQPNGPLCTCGNRGCLEAIAGRWAIERDIRAAFKKRKTPYLRKHLTSTKEPIKSGVLAEALQKKDPIVTPIMNNAALTLGSACVSLRHMLDPELFLFGGGVIEACGAFILPKVRAAINRDPFFKRFKECAVEPAQLGDDAVMLGAVAMVIQPAPQAIPVNSGPLVTIGPNQTVIVSGKIRRESFFIRADGKVKKFQHGLVAKPGVTVVELNELKKILKKNPEILFIGTSVGTQIALSAEVLKWLKSKKISVKTLPLQRAVQAFNRAPSRKALLSALPSNP